MLELIEEIERYNVSLLTECPLFKARSCTKPIDWNERLIGIWGPKGVGKTTLLLNRLRQSKNAGVSALYLSLDHPICAGVSLIKLIEAFYKSGGAILYLDEVHKYEEWSTHLKAVFDSMQKIKIVFSGSSALHLNQGRGDLSRRANMVKLPVISFREFVNLETEQDFNRVNLNDLLKNHLDIADELLKKFKPLEYFRPYLEYGAFPFYRESKSSFAQKLIQVVNHTLESDLVFVNGLDARYSAKLRSLLSLVSASVPIVPKITGIAQALELSRPTVSQYLKYLEDGGLISLLHAEGRGYQKLAKPEKIYLDNTNLMYALSRGRANIGTVRETFCGSQLREAGHFIEAHHKADFLIDNRTVVEVGGPNKDRSQLKGVENGILLCDEIDRGDKNRIPLWLAGFLY